MNDEQSSPGRSSFIAHLSSLDSRRILLFGGKGGVGKTTISIAAALDSMQEKHRDMVRQLTRKSVRDAIDDFIDDFEKRARRRREMLADARQSAFVPVALSETWVVEQTRRLIDEVRADGLDVPFVVLNRTAPEC